MTYVPTPGTGVTGADAQFPTTRTLNAGAGGTFSVLGVQNNDTSAPDSATRLYVVPRAGTKVTAGTGGAIKVFADDYFADATNYRDLGIYFSANQNSDTGAQGDGVFWVNSKANGSYAGGNPDIGFSFQDGATVAGRWAYLSSTQPVLIVGSGAADIAAKTTAVKLEVQGDIGFNGSGRGFRWLAADGTASHLIQFNTYDATIKLNSAERFKVNSAGSVAVGNSSAVGASSTEGHLHLPAVSGSPTGTPAAQGSRIPVVVEPGTSKLWAYIGGAWKSVTFT